MSWQQWQSGGDIWTLLLWLRPVESRTSSVLLVEVDDSPDTVGPGELLVQVQQASSDLDIVMDVPCFATSHFNTKNYLVG